MHKLILFLLALLFVISSCNNHKKDPDKASMQISFVHKVDGAPLVTNQMIYTNTAGNPYEVTEVMYFISDLKLHKNDGTVITPATWDDIHYVDTNIPSTHVWNLPGDISAGTYDSITFTFGISQAKNQSFMFVNPPEVNMAWPDILGGGYHYMMLNGWWLNPQNIRQSFNFHFGIGQIYLNNSGQIEDITGFVHNAFTVRPVGNSFVVDGSKKIEAELTMHIESWFNTPHVYDHNVWGGAIMQNQAAMQMGCENGRDAFTILISVFNL